uniref:F-box associated beta-propeller type 3 domain-containing protein n=1 Tax=Arundo donax TaxID=35708 RepID=A0A0A8YFS7_ARUDO
MISNPRFIVEHAYRAPKCLLLYLPKLDMSTVHHRKILKPCSATVIDEKWSPSTWAASHMDPDDHLFASCYGLLCFYKTYTLKIANPATGQCLHLSKPDGILLHDFHYLYSFGFHPMTGEYKLVHFLREPQHYKSGCPFHFDTIQVYTLGEDKGRNIRAPGPCCMVNLGVVNVDGSMYWLTEDEGTSCGMSVVSFDLREETFASIQLPPLGVKKTASCSTPTVAHYITEIDGKVCIVTIPYQSHVPRWRRYNAELSGRMDIWGLESRVEHKWFLKYSIQSPSGQRYVPQPCFIHRGRIVLQDRDGNVCYHDLPGKNARIVHREEVKLLDLGAYRFYETQSYFYKETLVPLNVYAGAAIVRARPRSLAPPFA